MSPGRCFFSEDLAWLVRIGYAEQKVVAKTHIDRLTRRELQFSAWTGRSLVMPDPKRPLPYPETVSSSLRRSLSAGAPAAACSRVAPSPVAAGSGG